MALRSLPVMPALVAGIHVFPPRGTKVVDGRDKPGDDADTYYNARNTRPMAPVSRLRSSASIVKLGVR